MPATVETNLNKQEIEAWQGLLHAYSTATGTIDAELQAAGLLPLAWCDVLLELSQAPREGLRMQDLAQRVALSKSGMTRLVDRLVEAGLLARLNCPSDRRVLYATISELGRQRIEETWPTYAAAIRRHFLDHLSPGRIAAIAGGLAAVANAEKKSPPCSQ